ncbi:TldD/PmbA family protein [Mesoaciditoga sp.]
MKVDFSPFLEEARSKVRELVKRLCQHYDYVSVLGTDSFGTLFLVNSEGVEVRDSMWTERGFVVRVHDGNYREFSFNRLDNIDEIEKEVLELVKLRDTMKFSLYPVIDEENLKKDFSSEVRVLPSSVSAQEKIERLFKMKDMAFEVSKKLVNFNTIYEEVTVNKLFVSEKKELSQSYVWTQGYLQPIVSDGKNVKSDIESFSGLKGVELLEEMEEKVIDVVKEAESLLNAQRLEPGEYDVICSPDVSGVIAHEAFGHGVEMDMFVKNRAKAAEYMGKRVGSDLVSMHDGAAAAKEVSSYFFDDEGTLAHDTLIIDKGILKAGLSDLLSAMKLHTIPTGNGKRESFERKAYARMTNTFFTPGEDTLEDMIKSIKHGYLLEKYGSGMEDPKNWGIQVMITYAREIKDGKLTDKVISPIIITGYVPDLLNSISMVSKDFKLSGSGACGKGYKEYVKVSAGGPYIKAKARLG